MSIEHDIRYIDGSLFHDQTQLALIEQEILSITQDDQCDSLLSILVQRLTDEWLLDDAERIVQKIRTPDISTTWLLGRMARRFAYLGQTKHASHILHKAVQIARGEEVASQRAEAIAELARHFYKIGEREAGLTTWREAVDIAHIGETEGDVNASSVLWEITERVAAEREWEFANQVAHSIQFDEYRGRVLSRLEQMISIGHRSKEADR